MTMVVDREQKRVEAQAELDENARQHQAMRISFSAYREFLEWINVQIRDIDDAWELHEGIDRLRGKKEALRAVRDHLEFYLKRETIAP